MKFELNSQTDPLSFSNFRKIGKIAWKSMYGRTFRFEILPTDGECIRELVERGVLWGTM